MSDLETLRKELEAAQAELRDKDKALKQIEDLAAAAGKKPESLAAYKQFLTLRDDGKAHVESLQNRVAAAERAERTKTIVEPMIEAFGTLTVDEAKEFRIEFSDIDAEMKKLNDEIAVASSKLKALDKLNEVMVSLQISQETAADLKAVRFEASSPKAYKLAVARSGGPRGPRASTSDKIYVIEEAGPDYQHLVGARIGKDQDYANWRVLVEKANPQLFAELEEARKGKVNDKGQITYSNWSGSVIASRKLGIKFSEQETAPAA